MVCITFVRNAILNIVLSTIGQLSNFVNIKATLSFLTTVLNTYETYMSYLGTDSSQAISDYNNFRYILSIQVQV